MTEKSAGQSTSAATDITEFISDLDGGVFERALSVALSQAAVIDFGKKGKVEIKFDIERKVPMLNLRIVNAELHAEQMAAELATLISDTLGDSMPVLLGDYRTAP